MLKNFIKSIREEEGYSFYKPWRLDEKSLGIIVPVVRESVSKRDYITFAEASDIEVRDTGQIDYVYVKNNSSKSVLITRGEIFRGKTQERAAVHSHIVLPNSGLRVAVRCVHKSKGISPNTTMKYGGKVPYSIDLSEQHKTWDTVKVYCSNYSDSSTNAGLPANFQYYTYNPQFSTLSYQNLNYVSWDNSQDSLVDGLDKMSEMMKVAMTKMPKIKNQIGAAFLDGNNLLGLEVYDVPKSWDVVKADVVEKEGATLLSEYPEDLFELKPDKVNKFLKKKLDIDFTEQVIYDKDYTVVVLKNESYGGEGTIYKGKVVHLVIYKK